MELNKLLKSAIFLVAMLGFVSNSIHAISEEAFTEQDSAVFDDPATKTGFGSKVKYWLMGGTAALAIAHVVLAKYLGKGIMDINGIYGDTAASIKLHQLWTRIRDWKAEKRSNFVGWLWRRGGSDDELPVEGSKVLAKAGAALKQGAQMAEELGAKGAVLAGDALSKGRELKEMAKAKLQDPAVREKIKNAKDAVGSAAVSFLWYNPVHWGRWLFSGGEKRAEA